MRRHSLVLLASIAAVSLLAAQQEVPATIEVVPQDRTDGACCDKPAFSPDGRVLATRAGLGLELWDTGSGRKLRFLPFRMQRVGTALSYSRGIQVDRGVPVFSPDGRFVAVVPDSESLYPGRGGPDTSIADVWSVETGEPVGEPDWPSSGNGPPANETLPWTRTELESWRHVHTPVGTRRAAQYRGSGRLFVADGTRAVSIAHGPWPGGSSTLTTFDVETGARTMSLVVSEGIPSLEVSADGRWLGVANGGIRIFDGRSGDEKYLQVRGSSGVLRRYQSDPLDRPRTIAFSDDGTMAAVAFAGRVTLFSTDDWGAVRDLPAAVSTTDRPLRFSADGTKLAAVNPLQIWDVASGTLVHTIDPATASVGALAFTPDGSALAFAISGPFGPDSSPSRVKVWNPAVASAPPTIATHDAAVMSLAFTPDGKRLISGSSRRADSARSSGREGAVLLTNVVSAEIATTLATPGWESSSPTVGVTPDGQQLAALILVARPVSRDREALAGFEIVQYDAVIRRWDAANHARLRDIRAGDETMAGLSISPNGRRIAAVGYQRIHVFSRVTGRPVNRITVTDLIAPERRSAGQLNRSVWLSDSRHLVVAGDGGLIGIWDALSGQLVTALPGASTAIHALAVDDGGRRIAAGDCEGNLHIWRAPRWEHSSLRAHQGCITTLAFSATGQLASGGHDGVVQIWNALGRSQAKLMVSRTTEDWLAVSPDGRYDGTPQGIQQLAAFTRGRTAWIPSAYPGATYVPDLFSALFRR